MTDASGALEAREARASDVPSIAVVIPAYQAADYLRRSLAALTCWGLAAGGMLAWPAISTE